VKRLLPFIIVVAGTLSGCANMSAEQGAAITQNLLQIATLNNESIAQAAQLSAQEMDAKHQVAPANNKYAIRLKKLTQNYQQYDGLNLNFKVYLDDTVNAFAMPDGTVRVYSGLMDAMPDDQVLAVIGHEIGHVRLKHSYNQMKKQLIANTAFNAVASVGGTIGDLTKGQLGQLGYAYINAHFSQHDELESDTYAVKFLASQGKDPKAMRRSIETLSAMGGGQANFLSSHPSHTRRLKQIDAAIANL